MNAKHGAAIGMAMAAITLLGLINLTPRDAALPPAPIQAKADDAGEAAGVQVAAYTDTPAAADSVGVRLATGPVSASLVGTVLNSSVAQIASCDDIYLDFSASPRNGQLELMSRITCRARLGGDDGEFLQVWDEDAADQEVGITAIEWYRYRADGTFGGSFIQGLAPGANVQLDPLRTLAEQPFPMRFTYTIANAGRFDVGMRLTLRTAGNVEFKCPPDSELPFIVTASRDSAYIQVASQESDGPASISTDIAIPDGTGLYPMSDWVSLFYMNAGITDESGNRVITLVDFTLTRDPRSSAELPYVSCPEPITPEEILEFALFMDNGDGAFDPAADGSPVVNDGARLFQESLQSGRPMLRWSNRGYPLEIPNEAGTVNYDDLQYTLSFVFESCSIDPTVPDDPFADLWPYFAPPPDRPSAASQYRQWPIGAPESLGGYGYFVAMRTSPKFRSGKTVSIQINDVNYQPWNGSQLDPTVTGAREIVIDPVTFELRYFDNYNPDFLQIDGPLVEDTGYSSSFNVFDLAGPWDLAGEYTPGLDKNAWDYPLKRYNPVLEYTRPRWDQAGAFLEIVLGEYLDVRQLFATEAWIPALGIDLHGPGHRITELNIIMTDVGADPYGPPGNGGFDPRSQLNRQVNARRAGLPILDDYTFNGVGLFEDQNNDGLFNTPTATGAGATFNGDFSMAPVRTQTLDWEYVPFPPGGGDPWWKLKLRLSGYAWNHTPGEPHGPLEAVPDNFTEYVPFLSPLVPGAVKADYFVVIRPDSGYTDTSTLTGDGTGFVLGADTRVFLDPLRWNAGIGTWDGGLRINDRPPTFFDPSEAPADIDIAPLVVSHAGLCNPDPRDPLEFFVRSRDPNSNGSAELAYPEPYWYERTHNRDTVKPIRGGLEVHDLVLLYDSSNEYAKNGFVNVGDDVSSAFCSSGYAFLLSDFYLDAPSPVLGTGLIHERASTPVFPDLNVTGRPVRANERTYAYESVPFEILEGDDVGPGLVPRDPFFPNPAPQPGLPSAENWPIGDPEANLINFGFESSCYLLDEGEENEPFGQPTSQGSEATYEDDIYAYDVDADPVLASDSVTGYWLIDREGGRFRILGNAGNSLRLERGHAAYLDADYLDPALGKLDIDSYPFGVQQGPDFAVKRGAWVIAREAALRNEYTRVEQWPNGAQRASRLLRQRIDTISQSVAMLGVNLVGSEDPNVNTTGAIALNSITVAFWGPEFDREDLAKLDRDGELFTSGVALYEDTNGNGVFDGWFVREGGVNAIFIDRIVPLEPNSLQWGLTPELIDIDGDKEADDMSGDGVVSNGDPNDLTPEELTRWDGLDDRAWVLRLQPDEKWVAPESDTIRPDNAGDANGAVKEFVRAAEKSLWPEYWTKGPVMIADDEVEAVAKDFLPATLNEGDDLFVVIRTSEMPSQFEQFRCVVPSTLPERFASGGAAAQGGIEVSPRNYPVAASFVKSHPDEGVEPFYGHDMLLVSVPSRVQDLSASLALSAPDVPSVPVIVPGGPPAAVLGVDLSANRLDNLIAQIAQIRKDTPPAAAQGEDEAEQRFRTDNVGQNPAPDATYYSNGSWTDGIIGFWLIALGAESRRYEAYEITGVDSNELLLRAGNPLDGGPWQIVRDPSFLEEMIVELYDVEGDTPGLPRRGDGKFDPQYDLLELNFEDPANGQLSGVSIYRDNDFHPDNTNGVFDAPVLDEAGTVLEYIDLPVQLDDPPHLIGVQGEPQYQVRFVFSSPGTDDFADGRTAADYESQPLLRQPIPQTFGNGPADPEYGSDFFVVVRTSRRMSEGDNFSVAIASWGPDTPSEPDPDNFRVSNIPGVPQQQVGDSFNLFQEFPWGNRGVGLITFFREAPIDYFWGFDNEKYKVVARQERDTSQDERRIRYWSRSSPDTFGRTATITALEGPAVDFTADRRRQAPGQPVQFTLLATGTIRSVLWDFGDGTTDTVRNPLKIYARPGIYDVSVTVTDRFGVTDSEIKTNYIEILDPPYADFVARPTDGTITPDRTGVKPPGLDVTFTNTSVGTDDIGPVASFWDFGDGQTSTEPGFPTNPDDPNSTEGLLVHRYLAPGIYTVKLQVTFRDSTSGQSFIRTCIQRNLITVRPCVGCPSEGEGEGEGEDPPAADFTVASQIDARDRESLLPLNDWVPLFRFTMGYGEEAENVAPRFLRTLVFTLRPDEREPEDLNYGNQGPPDFTDIEEFGLFVESFSDSDDDTVLDSNNDFALFRWNSLGIADNGSPIARLISSFPLAYELDLIGNGTPEEPEFPVPAGPTGDGTIDGESYIIGMRTSATWRSQITMGVDVNFADMVVAGTGEFPVNDDGEPIDSYSPNFFDGETFEEDASYSSSFTVFDMTGRPFGDEVAVAGLGDFSLTALPNTWTNPLFIYTPAAEHTRPRWNQLTRLTELFSGEVLELRELIPIETWRPLLGINAHATKAVHYLTVDDEDPSLGRFDFEDDTLLQEVNLVFTDIGADPFGAPGNGGFDPREALERVISENYGQEPVVGRDYIYNGAWVFWDNNNNGLFDAPVALDTGGVTYSSQDRPMVPASFDGTDNGDWEYVPFPPGGGDPWWRIKLRFLGYAAQFVNEGDEPIGMLEKAPDQLSGFDDAPVFSETSFDYFVVARTDSGERDVSLQPGDGAGIKAGADFRVFIEPRRFNASTGSEDGGIYIDGMIPPIGPRLPSGGESSWQNDPRWGATEPWWPARTLSPEAAKPQRVGLEVHDLALTYESDSRYARVSDLHFGGDPFGEDQCFGYSFGLDEPTDFEQWMDPFGLRRGRFLNRHSVGVYRLQAEGRFFRALQIIGVADIENAEAFPIQYTFDTERSLGQHAFETVPFFNSDPVVGDVPPSGPRSNAFPLPPFQPAVPDYATWPGELAPGDYPRQSDWRDEDNAARLLTQKMDIESTHTPLLGFNLAGAEDPIINAAEPVQLAQMTVALWGPDFTPADLQPLDPSGQSRSSGVLLWEDQDGDGTFFDGDTIAAYNDLIQRIGGLDQVVPLRNLAWGSAPEPIDLDGDGVADDMDGNGLVDEADYAWVLRITPEDLWEVPQSDAFTLGDATGFDVVIDEIGCGTFDFGSGKDEPGIPLQRAENKALETDAPQPGDDLFLTVRTSDQAERFEKVRAVVPATLPGRSLAADRLAGVQFFPQVATDPGAFMKTSPEEDPVQDFYGHDTMEVNVPVKLVDMTNAEQNITVGGPGVPVLGLDLATNRSEGTVASGTGGLGSSGMFTVSGQAWAPNALAGDWLVDSRFETYAIVSNNATQLQLLSGTPRDGSWRIVRDPSFLEQVIVEFYNEGTNADFNPLTDLLPLNLDQRLSGVALYRDNDLDARNGNGVFDPGIDIPLNLDAAPTFVGLTGQDIQVKFVFSTPGTDDVSGGVQGGGLTLAEQTRNRQWVPDTFGARAGDRDFGPDFFVVVRASTRMSADDNFRMGIVSWGPNTPTEPDPDTWAGLPESQRNDFTKFQEFPWSSRGLGFITFFKEPPLRYFLDGNVAGQKEDTSGFDWLRSHTSKKRRTGVITARQEPDSPFALRIDGGSPKLQLPTQTLPGQPFEFVLRGKGFGANPSVVISGYDVAIVAATDTAITLRVSTRPGAPPQEPIVVIVRNPDTNREASRDDIFTLVPGTADRAPSVTGLSPARANELLFPVTVTGADFPDGASLEVYFGATRMPVLSSTATGIVVGFPAGGFPGPGQYDVTVRNTAAGTQGVLVGGFTFENKPRKPGPNILGCGAAPAPGAGAPWGDAAAMLGALALLAAAAMRRRGTAGA